MKRLLLIPVNFLFVLSIHAQSASQWLLRSDVILDFSQSPVAIVSIPDSISSTYRMGIFSHIESDMAGNLKVFALGGGNLDSQYVTVWDSNFITINNNAASKYLYIRNFRDQYSDFNPYILNTIKNENLILCMYKEKQTGISNVGLFKYSQVLHDLLEINTMDRLDDSRFLYFNDSKFYIVSDIPLKPYAQKRIELDLDRKVISIDTIETDSIGLGVEFSISSNRSPIYASVYTLEDSKVISDLQFNRIDSNRAIQLIRQITVVRNEPRWTIEGIRHGCFSPNDSIFYFCHEKDGTKDGKSASSLAYFNIYTGKTSELVVLPDTNIVINSMATAPDGKIYFEYKNDLLWMPKTSVGVINYPDKAIDAIEVQLDFLVDNDKYDDLGPYAPNTIIGQNFLKIKCLQKECTDSFIQCFNYSDTLYKTFKWELMDMDSNLLEQRTTKNSRFYPPKTGTYLIRATGKTRFGRNAYRWDKVFYRNPPKIDHNLAKDTLCRYSKKLFKSRFIGDSTEQRNINWYITSKTKTENFSVNSFKYTFTDTGFYSVKLVFNNGYCIDSMVNDDYYYVIDAPYAGFEISRDTICTSTEIEVIDKSSGSVKGVEYVWNDGISSSQRSGHRRTFDTSGNYKVIQTLKSSNSCISKDSMFIRVKKGLTHDSIPNLIVASVIDSTKVSLQWKEINGIQSYTLTRLNDQTEFKFPSPTHSYIDSVNAALSPISYKMKALDSCNMISGTSNPAKTILLETKNYNNEFIDLDWNKYEKWENGVAEYLVQRSPDGKHWNNIAGLESTNFQDNTIPLNNTDSVYFRIIAIQNQVDTIQSASNMVKVSLKSTAFIPNAFTPNNDGVNDTFKIGSFGIRDFYCIIFSNTGQVVGISYNPTKIWDGVSNIDEPYPTDTYYYIMTFTNSEGESIKLSGIINLIAD
ncbi:T9SS type B sorting domain-containing protein [bacterium]|nr:T9SS type B sorting domain-containing protein [bacterium]